MFDGVDGAISVVIPHFGDPAPTLALVDALSRQVSTRPLEVIVVDDASPDPFPTDVDAIVVRRDANGGFGSAVNAGVAVATHERLLILNSDLSIDEDFVEQFATASEPWMPAVTGPRVVDHDGKDTWSGRQFPTVSHQFVEWLTPLARWRSHLRLHHAVGHDVHCGEGHTTMVDWLVGAVLYLPTKVFRDAGGFDEDFYMNSEETDLQRRLRDRGVPSIHVGTVNVIHEGGGSSGDSAKRRRWLVDSRLHYADKWGGRRRLQVSLAAATGVNLVHNAARRTAGRPIHPIQIARTELGLFRNGQGSRT